MLKNFVRRMTRPLGVDIRRFTVVSDPFLALNRFARLAKATVVIDVGANIGQFALAMIHAGWDGPIISFEPLSAEHRALKAKAARFSGWQVGPKVAIGATQGTAQINVAGNSVSSSLLPMLETHLASTPQSAFVGEETVEVVPLDDALAHLGPDEHLVLKLDVQGFEGDVLAGAGMTLARSAVVYVEMSLQPLYGGEKLFNEISAMIMDAGFRCVGLFPGHFDTRSGEMLQVDGLFVR